MSKPDEHDHAAAVATLLLVSGMIMENASVMAAAAPREAAALVRELAAAGADIAALTAAAAVLARLGRPVGQHGSGNQADRNA